MKEVNLFASVLPGRIRLRHPMLRNRDFYARMRDNLSAFVDVEANPATGSLLLRYDPADTEMEARIRAEVAAILGFASSPSAEAEPQAEAQPVVAPAPRAARRRRRAKWEVNRVAKIGSVASMAVSLAALASSRKLHAQAGVLAVALMLVHVIVHRRHVLR